MAHRTRMGAETRMVEVKNTTVNGEYVLALSGHYKTVQYVASLVYEEKQLMLLLDPHHFSGWRPHFDGASLVRFDNEYVVLEVRRLSKESRSRQDLALRLGQNGWQMQFACVTGQPADMCVIERWTKDISDMDLEDHIEAIKDIGHCYVW